MLTLFHDYTSPASAVAVARLERLASAGVAATFEGFEVHGVDVDVPTPIGVLAELDTVADAARAEGVQLRRPRLLPATARAHVVGRLAEACGAGGRWRAAAYAAFWSHSADLHDPATLIALSAAAGLDADRVAELVADPLAVATERRRMLAHRRNGVGGVPCILAHRTLVPGLLDDEALRSLAA